MPSFQWLMGRIIKLYPDQDGVVRVVAVFIKNKKRRTYKSDEKAMPDSNR